MFKKLTNFFSNYARLKLIVLFFFLVLLMLFIFPLFEYIVQMPENIISLDSSNLYSSKEIHKILTEWGSNGRIKQIWLHLTWDLIFPILYFFFLGFLISYITSRTFKASSKMQKAFLLSFVALVDILENISLIILILIYPKDVSFLGCLKTGFTFVKYYVFGPALLICILVSTVFLLVNKFIKK